jgi:hypothetical protein
MPNIADEVTALAERTSKKAAQLALLLRDPDLAHIVARLSNGSSAGQSALPQVPAEAGGVREAIRSIYAMLPERFTSVDVFELLKQQSYPFTSKDAMSSIRDQLYALCSSKINEIRVVKKGKGGKPNFYGLVLKP